MRSLSLVLALFVLGGLAAAQRPKVIAVFGDERVAKGEKLRFGIVIEISRNLDAGGDADPKVELPKLPEIPGLTFRYEGGGLSEAGSSVMIVNGRRSGSINYRGQWLWEVEALETGRYMMPSLELKIDGDTYRTQSTTLVVLADAPGNRWVGLAVVVDDPEPYVNQPIRLRWVLSSERQVVESRDSLPMLDIPWAGSPAGFQPGELVLAGRRDGNAVGAILDERRIRLPARILRERKPPVIEMSLEKSLIPLAPGRIELGGTSARLQIARSSDRGSLFRSRRYSGVERAFVTSDPIVLDVRDAPTEGRPSSYSGAIGDFDVEVAYGSGRFRAGDGTTLKLVLKGSPVVDLIEQPLIDELFSDCRVLANPRETSGEGDERRVEFSWLIKPLRDDLTELPRYEFSWFRPKPETFETVGAGPLQLDIVGELEEEAVFEGANADTMRKEIAVLGEGVRPLREEPGRFRTPGTAIPLSWFIAVLALPLLSLVALSTVLRKKRALSGDVAAQRRRKASKEAQARLGEARSLLGQKGFHGRLSRCITGLVADKLALPPASVTAATARDLLVQGGVGEARIDETARLLDELDHAEFGGMSGGDAEQEAFLGRAEDLLSALDREIRS